MSIRLRCIEIAACMISLTGCTIAQNTTIDYLGISLSENSISTPKYKVAEFYSTSIPLRDISVNKHYDFEQEYADLINNRLKLNSNQNTHVALHLLDENEVQMNLKPFQKRDYYKIEFNTDTIKISAFEKNGAVYAYAVLDHEYSASTKLKRVESWPDIDQRGIQVNLKGMDPSVVKGVAFRILRGHYNYALFSLQNSVRLKSIDPFVMDEAMPKSDFKDLVKYYENLGIKVVPHLNFLSHQDRAFVNKDVNGELLYNVKTLDPTSKASRKIVINTINEVIDLIDPKELHIGHDEVIGHIPKQVAKYGNILPPEQFIYSVNYITNHLKSKNVETWMWGDMMLYAPNFPEMHSGALNGTREYIPTVDSISKDILICDWHYKHYRQKLERPLNFGSVDYFLSKGFRVAGATYEQEGFTKQFANYCYSKDDTKLNNMLATTWHKLLKGTTKAKASNDSLHAFDKILQESAEYFWNASNYQTK